MISSFFLLIYNLYLIHDEVTAGLIFIRSAITVIIHLARLRMNCFTSLLIIRGLSPTKTALAFSFFKTLSFRKCLRGVIIYMKVRNEEYKCDDMT